MATPGWYKDAKDPALARWHDGEQWTEHTIVLAEHSTPPPDPTASVQPAFTAPAAPPPAAPTRQAAAPTRQEVRADAASAKARAKAMRPWYRKKRWWAVGALLLIIAISVAASSGSKKDDVTSSSRTTNTTTEATEPANTNKISADEFAAIQSGMTLAQVEGIIGGPGELLSDVNVAGQHDQVYMWDGSNASGLGANANVTFANDRVVSKAQFGLK
jgi:hypothetical protein